ncbi:VOC family protein [Paenarthrobacter nicotinovorans]|uniref:VOC family protein n=1 Tax=Paenarthrobacter nicotinovorans TaxID=29320 RepID=UPI001665022F|nr:VOC family protein [Paenarthrobacter nicotinovorans]MBP2395169.1 catechol-2,3-dioxygenase [Paenarthrobacter nicotinovorans]UKE98683.1 VOC family protein [Paenarthrobacter nicotinovorans]UKF03472.1 VOC family protein [Paenarthrobacter nicotinovorans]GGV36599.1 oxidoreductase [Paenarthrobacter nicotinovorans]
MTFFAAEPVCKLRSLRSVSLKVPRAVAAKDFYHEVWGLSTVEEDSDRFWLRGTGSDHHILRLEQAEQNGLGSISFALSTPRDVDVAAVKLAALGIPLFREPGPLDDAAGGYGLQLVDPEGRLLELSANVHAVVSQEPGGRRALPRKIAHVVLNTVDIDRATDFYTQVLGMRISDWSEHQMAFLRCNAEHHVIAFNQAPWSSVNHVAYEMQSIDHFMRGIGSLKSHGIAPQWGPGRHGPGDNTFSYFTDPNNLVCEYTSEVAQVNEDSWLCRTWRRTPELSDQWGTAGPPTATVRSAMAGIADPGYRDLVQPESGDYFLSMEAVHATH